MYLFVFILLLFFSSSLIFYIFYVLTALCIYLLIYVFIYLFMHRRLTAQSIAQGHPREETLGSLDDLHCVRGHQDPVALRVVVPEASFIELAKRAAR